MLLLFLTTALAMAASWLRVIQINDVYELDNFASLKTLIDQHRKQETSSDSIIDRFCVICAGDFLAPSLLSSLDKGTSMVDILNVVGCTHVCLGNHETDVPSEALKKRMEQSNFVWINSNMPELNEKLAVNTPDHVVMKVGKRRVAVLGLLTDDSSLYRPGAFAGARISPVMESAQQYADKLQSEVDLILPVTHQGIADDRIMATQFGGKVFPLLMGGHDHEPFDETHNGARIIKTGMDAEAAAVIDIRWEEGFADSSRPEIQVELKRTADYAPDPAVAERIATHQQILKELEGARLFNIADWIGAESNTTFSTRNNRMGPSTGTSALCSMFRMGLRSECAILNAGSVRASVDYAANDTFAWSDLKAEMPFPTHMTVCRIPGRILERMIRHSRQFAKHGAAQGCFLHTSRNLVYNDETEMIESVAGRPFQPDREYLTALPLQFFHGLDNHVPLLEWAKTATNTTFLDPEAARPAKLVLVELFSSLLWLQLGSFDSLSRGDGAICKDDLRVRLTELYGRTGVAELMLDNVFSIADVDKSGTISSLEQMIVHFVATDMLEHVVTDKEIRVLRDVVVKVLGSHPSSEEVEKMAAEVRRTLDLTGTGTVQREEVMRALGEVRNRELLE